MASDIRAKVQKPFDSPAIDSFQNPFSFPDFDNHRGREASLLPGDAYIEVLRSAEESDGFATAAFADGAVLELPVEILPKLQGLVGELVAVVRIGDLYFCGRLEAS